LFGGERIRPPVAGGLGHDVHRLTHARGTPTGNGQVTRRRGAANAFSPDNLQAFARDAISCVTQANSLLSVAADKAAVDQLGFATNTVGPLASWLAPKPGTPRPS
jgi:hypothetical protein